MASVYAPPCGLSPDGSWVIVRVVGCPAHSRGGAADRASRASPQARDGRELSCPSPPELSPAADAKRCDAGGSMLGGRRKHAVRFDGWQRCVRVAARPWTMILRYVASVFASST